MTAACRVVAKFGQTEATGTFFIWEDEPTNLRTGSFYTDNANPTMNPSQVGGWTVFSRRPREIGAQASFHF